MIYSNIRENNAMNRKKGFTLIELLVVIVIVGILAAISIPIMRGHKKRAILTEAVAGLGTIRTLQRAYHVEHNEYQDVGPVGSPDYLDGLRPGDLTGTYFSENCYMIRIGMGNNRFSAYCYVQPLGKYPGAEENDAPKAADAISVLGEAGYIWIDHDGNIRSANIPGSGYE